MSRFVYFFGFVLLTAADWILGYKAATSFGITELWLQILWAGGFAVMSIPLKLIYDYCTALPYQLGKVLFSLVWLYLAYMSLEGVSHLRKTTLQQQQLEATSKASIGPVKTTVDTMQVRGRFTFQLRREAIRKQAMLDSLKLVAELSQNAKKAFTEASLVASISPESLLYINLLLMLSAAVCLSVALTKVDGKADYKAPVNEFSLNYQEWIEQLNEYEKNLQAHFSPKTEYEVIESEEKQELKPVATKAGILQVRCRDCQVVFKSRRAYGGHMKNNSRCQTGNFELIPYELSS